MTSSKDGAAKTEVAEASNPHPYGRSLVDFGRLSPGETKLLNRCRTGEEAVVADKRPEKGTRNNRVRAAFVRFLALGGDTNAPIHEHGIQLSGAWLTGRLDFQDATAQTAIQLRHCRIDSLILRSANLKSIVLNGSRIEAGLWGDHLRCSGNFFARGGFEAAGPVRLVGSTIDGTLDLSGSSFENNGDIALALDRSTIGGTVFLNGGFRAVGEVRMLGATIKGNLDCRGGIFRNKGGMTIGGDRARISGGVALSDRFYSHGAVRFVGAKVGGEFLCSGGLFRNPSGDALMCDQISVSGSVFMRDGFFSTGRVRISSATVESNFECSAGSFLCRTGTALSCEATKISGDLLLKNGFEAVGHVRALGVDVRGDFSCNGGRFTNTVGDVLSCDGARVGGAFFFRNLKSLQGSVDLSTMHVATLCDDMASWAAAGTVILDGFTYNRFAGGATTKAKDRISWLELQPSIHLTTQFQTQPWEQLIVVLRGMGYPDEARTVAIAKHKRMRDAGRFVGGSKLWDFIYGFLVGYGYRPWRLLWVAATVWIACAGVYSLAIRPNWLGTDAPLLVRSGQAVNVPCLVSRIETKTPDPCPVPPPDYSSFLSLAYSAEVMLPVISLGSKAEWKPLLSSPNGNPLYWGWAIFIIYWFEIAFGWLAGLLLVSALGNLVKKD